MTTPVLFVPFGSRVYGTHRPDSDFDFIVVVLEASKAQGTELCGGGLNLQVFGLAEFQAELNAHKIHALEAFFSPGSPLQAVCSLALDRSLLRHELSQKASHSFVKARKKLEVEQDYLTGWKSLFHALRILSFGIQLARDGKLTDFSAANHLWSQIWDAQETRWDVLKETYQPLYNQLASEFRALAPKK